MPTEKQTTFFSYARADSNIVLKLATDLREAGAPVWLDQLDIRPGTRWDAAIESALNDSRHLIVVLSQASVSSNNVMDEVSYALENGKTVIPVLVSECTIPFRLKRLQYVDFTAGYEQGLAQLLAVLRVPTGAPGSEPVAASAFGVKQNGSPSVTSNAPRAARPTGQDAAESSPNTTKKPAKKRFLLAGGVIALLVLVFVLSGIFQKEDPLVESQTTNTETAPADSALLLPAIGEANGGGYFFGVDSNGHYLIAAPEDIESSAFPEFSPDMQLEDQLATLNALCAEKGYGGFNDWRVPDKDELLQLYQARKDIGGLLLDATNNGDAAPPDYFSATFYDDHTVFYQNFYDGAEGSYGKFSEGRIRPVRTYEKD